MKIGIFLENFTETELLKDPGIIAAGLAKSHEVVLIGKNVTTEASKICSVKTVGLKALEQQDFWENHGFDAVIMYSWLSIRYTKIVQAISQTKSKLILKLDSDGKLLYPLLPSYLEAYRLSDGLVNQLTYILRLIEWKIIPRIISKIKLRQIMLCDAVIIESEEARKNLCASLAYFKKENLFNKINFIPNPVLVNTPSSAKENIILCVGRFDDPRKDKKSLISSLSNLQTHWQVVVVGNESQKLVQKIQEKNKQLNIKSFEYLKHTDLLNLVARSKIFFSSSVSESFGLAAAEALCLGASIVSRAIPSFIYFSQQGRNGTLASDWTSDPLTKALEKDITKWESNFYNPQETSLFWQRELNPEKVTNQIIDLIENAK